MLVHGELHNRGDVQVRSLQPPQENLASFCMAENLVQRIDPAILQSRERSRKQRVHDGSGQRGPPVRRPQRAFLGRETWPVACRQYSAAHHTARGPRAWRQVGRVQWVPGNSARPARQVCGPDGNLDTSLSLMCPLTPSPSSAAGIRCVRHVRLSVRIVAQNCS